MDLEEKRLGRARGKRSLPLWHSNLEGGPKPHSHSMSYSAITRSALIVTLVYILREFASSPGPIPASKLRAKTSMEHYKVGNRARVLLLHVLC